MESKGRRGSRLAAPFEASAKPDEASEMRALEAEPTEDTIAASHSLEIALEPVELETADDLAALPASEPRGVPSEESSALLTEPMTRSEPDALAAWAQSQDALARGLEALSSEMAQLALRAVATAARAATTMLGVKTLSDAVTLNAGLACSSVNAFLGGSAKLSELGVQIAAETSRPFLSQFARRRSMSARAAC
jgi:hypothetical protein